jgi:hypothetical protein
MYQGRHGPRRPLNTNDICYGRDKEFYAAGVRTRPDIFPVSDEHLYGPILDRKNTRAGCPLSFGSVSY